MFDLIVIGAGLAGLSAAIFAARRGAKVLLLAKGWGQLSHTHGCIDCHGWLDGQLLPAPQWAALPGNHPYQYCGAFLAPAFAEFQNVCQNQQYPMIGSPSRNHWLPNAFGGLTPAMGVPISMVAADQNKKTQTFVLAALPNFSDSQPTLAQPTAAPPLLQLPAPPQTAQRTWRALDWAQQLDNPFERERILLGWRSSLQHYRRQTGLAANLIGLPAVLGLTDCAQVLHDAEDALEAHLFEIPTLPPSVPGLRLQRVLQSALASLGCQLVFSKHIQGQIQNGSASVRVTSAGQRSQTYRGGVLLLASGSFSSGGLFAPAPNLVRESCFGLPIVTQPDQWSNPRYLAQQPFNLLGLTVNSLGQPCDDLGKPFATNLWAAGAILAGADRSREGSRAGIALASAYAAVNALMKSS